LPSKFSLCLDIICPDGIPLRLILYASSFNNDINGNNTSIYKIPLNNPASLTLFANGIPNNTINDGMAMTIYNGYIYITNVGNNTISKISLANPDTDYVNSFAIISSTSYGITTDNKYIYGTLHNISTNNVTFIITIACST
jgi:hypothetical protein